MVVSGKRKAGGGGGVIVKQNFHFLLKILLYCLNLAGGRGRGGGRRSWQWAGPSSAPKANEDPSAKLGVGPSLSPGPKETPSSGP